MARSLTIRRVATTIATLAVLVSTVVAAFATAPAHAGVGQTISVDPADGAPAGTEVTVEGTGFAPGESITVSYVGETFGPVFADDAGTFSLTFTVPDAPIGAHPLDANGDAGGIAGLDYAVTEPASTPTSEPTPGAQPGTPEPTEVGSPSTMAEDPSQSLPESAQAGTTLVPQEPADREDANSGAGDDGSDRGWVPFALIALVVLIVVAGSIAIRFWAAPRGVPPGPCHDLAEKLERLRRWRERLREQRERWERDAADRRAKADRFHAQNQRAIEAERATAASATSGSTPKAWEAERLEEEARQAEEMRDQGNGALRSTDERIKELEKELEECIKNPPAASAPGGGASQPTDAGCCASGTWAGLVVVNGGAVGAGASGGFVFLWCIDDMDRSAKLAFTGLRLGPALGGEFAAVSLIGITGVRHPRDLAPAVSDVLDGLDWDLSVGAPLGRIARAGKGVGDRSFWKALIDHLSDVGKEVPSKLSRGDMGAAKEVMKEGLAKAGGKTATNDLESVAQGEPGATFSLPLAVGLQAGFWYLEILQMNIVSYDGCADCGSDTVRVRGF